MGPKPQGNLKLEWAKPKGNLETGMDPKPQGNLKTGMGQT